MGERTKIEWCDATWNPVTGCTPVSAGCEHCYARAIAKRFPSLYLDDFSVTYHPHRLGDPSRWRTPRHVFVCSMGDLFHPAAEDDWIETVLQVIEACPRHTFMVLTKRPHHMRNFALVWPDNLWAGVTIESAKYMERLDCLTNTPYPVRFLSCEPLLGPIPGIMRNGPKPDWVIVGCESGPGRRPMNPDWAREIRDQCVEANVPFFLKQMEIDGRVVKMPELDGRVWAERPTT